MFDVSRIDNLDLIPVHVHRGPSHICPNEGSFLDVFYSTSLFRVNHYAGSIESYFRTYDERRKIHKEKFEAASRVNSGVIYDAQPWLQAFLDNVGIKTATFLLQGVGKNSGVLFEPNEALSYDQHKYTDKIKKKINIYRSNHILRKRVNRKTRSD